MVYPVDDVALDVGDRPHVILMLAAFYEARQAGGVQGDFGVAAIVGLQPGMLQAGGCRGPPPEVFLQDHIDEVSGSIAHATEVFMWEAKVHPAHVDTCLLFTLIQEGGHATQHDIRQYPNAPDVCAQGDGDALDHFWGGKLGVPQQVVDVEVPRDLDGILQVYELHSRYWNAKVNEQVFRLRRPRREGEEKASSAFCLDYQYDSGGSNTVLLFFEKAYRA